MSQCRYVIKNKEERCKRNSLLGRDFCWQHDPYLLKGITLTGLLSFLVIVIGLTSDVFSLCDRFGLWCEAPTPIPTLLPAITVTASPVFNETLSVTPAVTIVPTNSSPAETPWAGPCNVEAFEVQPPSPQSVGTFVSIWIKASCIGDVRAIRLMINGEWYSEKGGHIAPPDEFGLNWQTAEYEPGEYQLTAEVATWGDDNWENSASQTQIFVLEGSAAVTEPTPTSEISEREIIGNWPIDCNEPGRDQSGKNPDATLIGDVSVREENGNCYLDFVGESGLFEVLDSLNLAPSQGEIVFRLRIQHSQNANVIAGRSGLFGIEVCGSGLRAYARHSFGQNVDYGVIRNLGDWVHPGEWHTIRFKWSDEIVELYVDEVKVEPDGESYPSMDSGLFGAGSTYSNLSVGAETSGECTDQFFVGQVDNIVFYRLNE